MANYETMYHHLFNAITDALVLLSEGDVVELRRVLEQAQAHTEALYIE